MTHGFERAALEEYREAASWYEEQRDGLGEEFVAAVQAAIAEIALGPQRCQPLDGGLRVWRMKRFPYQIIFRHDAARDHLTVFVLRHRRRHPDYWRDRL